MGVSQAKAEKWGLGLYTWTFTDGKAQLDWKGKATTPPYESYTCWYDSAVDGDSVRFTNTSSDPSGTCDGAVENSQWRLNEQGLHLHLVSAKDSEEALTAVYEAKPWQKVEAWSTGLPPNGVWQVELTADDFIKMGTLKSTADDMAGIYTWTFQDGQAKIEIHGPGITVSCEAVATVVDDFAHLQYVGSPTCDGSAYDEVQWRLDADGLHFHLINGNDMPTALKAEYESKPWQKIADQ
jgi:hypothetical protein